MTAVGPHQAIGPELEPVWPALTESGLRGRPGSCAPELT